MADEPKTQPTAQSVAGFIAKVADAEKRKSCTTLVQMLKQATKAEPVMWGRGIVGFGLHTFQYASGRTSEWPLIALAPRKNDVTLYIIGLGGYKALLDKLGKYTMGKGCLHIRKLRDVKLDVLKQIVTQSVKDARTS